MSQVERLLEIEMHGAPFTMNHYFNYSLDKESKSHYRTENALLTDSTRQSCTRTAATKKASADCGHGQVKNIHDLVQNHPTSNVEHVVRDLHDTLHC